MTPPLVECIRTYEHEPYKFAKQYAIDAKAARKKHAAPQQGHKPHDGCRPRESLQRVLDRHQYQHDQSEDPHKSQDMLDVKSVFSKRIYSYSADVVKSTQKTEAAAQRHRGAREQCGRKGTSGRDGRANDQEGQQRPDAKSNEPQHRIEPLCGPHSETDLRDHLLRPLPGFLPSLSFAGQFPGLGSVAAFRLSAEGFEVHGGP